MKVWDITQPKDSWGRGYAKLEYLIQDILRQLRKTIEIKDDKIFTCMTCGKLNTNWQWTCDRCDALECIAVDEAHDV